MGRKVKYKEKAEIVSISLDPQVLEMINEIAKKLGKPRSEIISQILRNKALNDVDFCRMKMKEAQREFHYWKSEKEILEVENNEKRR